MTKVLNPFTEESEAQRYNQFRPYYHNLPFQKLNSYLQGRIEKSLDVACGTGHSTRALAEISERVIVCDISESMLSEARKNLNIQFVLSSAEKLIFGNHEFNYLNISMAFQWLNQKIFLSEAHRVLKPNGLLGIDNYGFTGIMRGHEDFRVQYEKFDKTHMPSAPRNSNYPDGATIVECGFSELHEISYEQDVLMNSNQFVNYLMTRSNFLVLSADEKKRIESELNIFYKPLFNGEEKNLIFSGELRLYRAV